MQALRIRVKGQVQGVGFRPFVWQLARRFELRGKVLNDPKGVLIFAAGDGLEAFVVAIETEAPSLARIDGIATSPWEGELPLGFEIAASEGTGAQTRVTPDAATCPECLAEITTKGERRFGYAFANCTNCGPRFSILNALPYDRSKTTMAAFTMCHECGAEYADPADRRFHAQPIACPACGPKVWIEPEAPDPIDAATSRLRAGEVVAVKGIGGFHLVVDARNGDAVALLRQRKSRPTKPFALMGRLADIKTFSVVRDEDRALLHDPAAPIVLLEKRGDALPDGLAPNQTTLGWMLPYTPLHHLLIAAVDGPLVMTSGNLSGEPQVIGNDEARQKLSRFADAILMHDREIARRLDDSVERMTPHGPMILRRARGRVPSTLPLPRGFENAPQVLAVGAQMKAAICLVKDGQALLGHHLGELEDALTWDAFLQANDDYRALFDHVPSVVARDLHPEFRSSVYAENLGLPLVAVQHHHAHVAACLGENGWARDAGKVVAIVADGLGLGEDGTVWGGEIMVADYLGYQRIMHLRPAPLIGGDAASRDPWRNLLARLDQAGIGSVADEILGDYPRDTLRRAAASGFNAPLSSSVGRLFDAFAAALAIAPSRQSFEGEAAMHVEAIAKGGRGEPYPFSVENNEIDPAPMFVQWAKERHVAPKPEDMAFRFHAGLAEALAQAGREVMARTGAKAVALTGGCFQNALLLDLVVKALGDVPILLHRKTPANDGGIALGQALVAAARALQTAERE